MSNMASKKLHISQKAVSSGGTPSRTIQVWETAYNAKELSQNHWNFQIAKSVATGSGGKAFNIVWQSKNVAPSTTISWKSVYGLNWTAEIPAEGLSVTLSGDWQACSLGDIYDLDSNGFWTTSTAKADSNYMNVGKVNYAYPNVDGIHIVVGIQNDAGSFDLIYVDPTALAVGDSAKYQPQESVEWWYQTNMRNATMIESASTAIGGVDFSKPAPDTGNYYYSTTYNYKSGNWITSQDTPESKLYAAAQLGFDAKSTYVYSILPAILKVVFGIAVGKDKQVSASAGLKSLLDVKFGGVHVKFIDDLNLKVQLGSIKRAKPHSDDSLAVVKDDTERDVSDCLQVVYDDGDLPNGESWAVDYASAY